MAAEVLLLEKITGNVRPRRDVINTRWGNFTSLPVVHTRARTLVNFSKVVLFVPKTFVTSFNVLFSKFW